MSCSITYDELEDYMECGGRNAALDAGDSQGGQEPIERHVLACPDCQKKLSALHIVDSALRHLRPQMPSAETILATRRLLSEETRPKREPEILTLEEVAEFLRIPPEELAPLVHELPAFELGGQVRVRRSKLLEWVQQREHQFNRSSVAGEFARTRAPIFRKGVA